MTFAAVPEFQSSVSSGTGGAGRGTVDPYGLIYANPALAATLKERYLTSSFSKNQTIVSFLDAGVKNIVAGGLSYKQNQDDLKTTNLKELTLSLSDRAFDRFTFGINLNMFDLSVLDQAKKKQYTSDIGLGWLVTQDWHLGFVFLNSFKQGEKLTAPREAIGTSYIFNNFVRFRLDVESNDDSNWGQPIIAAGLENFINDWIVWRAGYREESLQDRAFGTVGLGFTGPRFGLHYAYVQDTQDNKENRHSIDLGLSF